MKISEAMQITLDSGLYLVNDQDSGPGPGSIFFCHALSDAGRQGLIPHDAASHARAHIIQVLDAIEVGTLTNYLKHTDKEYARLVARYDHWCKYCYNRRVKWIKAHIAKLQSQGR